jgi:hypothetical protein
LGSGGKLFPRRTADSSLILAGFTGYERLGTTALFLMGFYAGLKAPLFHGVSVFHFCCFPSYISAREALVAGE